MWPKEQTNVSIIDELSSFNMNLSPPANHERPASSMDDNKMETALTWIEKCIAIFSALSYSNLAAAVVLLRLIRPTVSFLVALLGDFNELAVVFLRIFARHAEIAARALELVNEKYFVRNAKSSCDVNVPTALDNNYLTVKMMKHETPSMDDSSRLVSDVKAAANDSAQKKKNKKPETKKSRGMVKIMELRENRRRMGLKVASKSDGCWD